MIEKEKLTVRITDAQRDTFWYADLIGETFEVTKDIIGDDYTLVGNEAERSLKIHPEDCEPAED